MRIAEKTIELNFCAQLTARCRGLLWFGLTQKQEAAAGFDACTRLHAAGVSETLGAWLVLAGLLLQSGWTLVPVKLIIIGLLLAITGPTATHALAKSALHGGLKPKHLERD